MSKAIPFVLKDNYLQVTLPGHPFALDSSHPTFERMKRAIKKKNWKAIPKLVSLAESISNETKGSIIVKKGRVYFKNREVHSALTDRIIQMFKKGKPVKHLLSFMDNLYKNPSDTAVQSFYSWLIDNDLPITDDGCFLAYKSVNRNNKDTHSNTVDNSPGQVIMMATKVANRDYDTQCSTGFHVCSKQYGVYGDKTMAVKVDPRYVLSAVEGKMRVTQYEVLKELGSKRSDLFQLEGFSDLEKKLVVEVKKERSEMLKMLLKRNDIKRLIRKRKMTKTSLMKASYARLKKMVQKFDLVPKVGPQDEYYIAAARKAAGLSIGQVAKKLGVSYKTVSLNEKKTELTPDTRDNYLMAIAQLTHSHSAVTYPKPVN